MPCWRFRPSPGAADEKDWPRRSQHPCIVRGMYFCRMAVANVTFVKKYPATKRMLRAFLKAADLCALELDCVARFPLDGICEESRLCGANPERDSLHPVARLRPGRYNALLRAPTPRDGDDQDRPAEDFASSTDWRFINELKKELKA